MAKNHRTDRRSLLRIWLYAAGTGVSGAVFVTGMIQNGNGAVERYNKLIAADKAGAEVEQALNELRSYIYTHMNAEVGGPNGIYPPIQLRYTYERLVAAEQKRVQKINDDLYTEAQEYCERTANQGFSGRNRLDCINAYVDRNGAKVQEIQDAFYKYDFVAPRWSPDVAGFGLIAVIIFGLMTLLQVVHHVRTRYAIHL